MNRVYIVLCIFSFSFIQINWQECIYDDYHTYIKQATKDINNKRYDKAKEHFNLAFEAVEVPLSKDIINALNLYLKANDEEMILKLSIILAKGGIPKNYFQQFQRLNWYPNFMQNFTQYDSIYKADFNIEYRRRISELIAYDINFNKKYHDWRSGNIDMSLNEMISEAKYIAVEFETLINEFGLPLEKKIGYYYDERLKRVIVLPIEVLIIHNQQRGKFLIQSDQIELLICNGLLDKSYQDLLPRIKGFSDEESIEAEMTLRYSKFGKKQ